VKALISALQYFFFNKHVYTYNETIYKITILIIISNHVIITKEHFKEEDY